MCSVTQRRCGGGGGGGVGELGTSGRGRPDLTGNIIPSPGFAFHANCFREEALPIQWEAHLNTNIPAAPWICHLESRPLAVWQLQQSSFSLHGIRHRFPRPPCPLTPPPWRASYKKHFAAISTHHWSPNELN